MSRGFTLQEFDDAGRQDLLSPPSSSVPVNREIEAPSASPSLPLDRPTQHERSDVLRGRQVLYVGDRGYRLTETEILAIRELGTFRMIDPRELATPTREGLRLLHRNRIPSRDQAVYCGFVRPKEANHDADLYRLYQKESARIQQEGGRVSR